MKRFIRLAPLQPRLQRVARRMNFPEGVLALGCLPVPPTTETNNRHSYHFVASPTAVSPDGVSP